MRGGRSRPPGGVIFPLRRVLHTMGRLANAGALVVAVAVIVAVLAVGAGLAVGYRPVVITGGSMGAGIPDRSLVVARPVDRVAVGDVLVMRRAGRATITHRVVELAPLVAGGPLVATTRGDANQQADPAPYPVGSRELVARWVIPRLGGAVLSTATPLVGTAVITTVVAILVLTALRRIWRPDDEPDHDPDDPGDTDQDAADGNQAEPADHEPGDGDGTDTDQRQPAAAGSGASWRRKWGAVAVASVLLGTAGVAWALYIDSAGLPANQFSAAACWDARVSGVQKGTTANTALGTQTVTISAVDPAKSFLLFTVRSTGNEPEDSRVLGSLASGTTLSFLRTGNSVAPPTVTIEWSVVTYACGVTVQRGTAAQNGTTTINVGISSVDPTASFVLGTSVPDSSALTYGPNDLVAYELTSATNLRISTDTEAAVGTAAFGWQVVTFDDAADIDVQTVTASLGVGADTATATLTTPVDLQSTFILASPLSTSGGNEIGERMIRARLLDASTVEIYRGVTTESASARIQVVTLNEGTTVQRGLVTMAPAATTAAATINPVDTSRTTAFTTVMEPGSLSGGSTTYTADDVPGEASAAVTVASATSLSLQRNTALATATFAWQAVTWGGPGWADTSYGLRQRLDITAGTVNSPTGYTTSVVVDHAALVASGVSLASGNDLRLWRYDGTTWTELDRVLDSASSWNSATTTLWFRTQEAITAGTTVSYWLYFGKTSPGVPPANPDNVWLLREGFESGLGSFTDRTGGTGWYQAQPWTRRVTLTVAESEVDATLTNQPVLVRLTSADLATYAQSDGSDIRFTLTDGTTLAHEIEAYDSGTGTLTAWVKVPSISATVNTTLYLYYGASDAPAQASPRTVWANELAAWHLSRSRTGPAPSLDDSSTSGLDGRALGDTALVDTASGPANDLDGTTDRLESSPRDLPDGPFTVSVWFKPDIVSGEQVLVSQGDPSGSGVFEVALVGTALRVRLRTGATLTQISGGSVSAAAWHLATVVWDGSDLVLYIDNGTTLVAFSSGGATVDGSAIAMTLGGDATGSRTLDGQLGEARISGRAWSAAEARFSYQNLVNPGTTVSASAAAGGTYLTQGSWSVRRPITVDHTLVAGNLTDYPLLVQVTDPTLIASTQSDGDDLVFTAADGVTRLDHDIESWNSATGALTAWVRIPALSATTDTELFLYLGNASAPNQEDPVGVWGAESDLVLTGG